jgi:hypothetical protein
MMVEFVAMEYESVSSYFVSLQIYNAPKKWLLRVNKGLNLATYCTAMHLAGITNSSIWIAV